MHPFKIQKCYLQKEKDSTDFRISHIDSKIKSIKLLAIMVHHFWEDENQFHHKIFAHLELLNFFCPFEIVLESFSIKKKNRMRPPSIPGKAWKWASFSLRLFHATLLYAAEVVADVHLPSFLHFIPFRTFLVRRSFLRGL